jgi:hypothetical protein
MKFKERTSKKKQLFLFLLITFILQEKKVNSQNLFTLVCLPIFSFFK